MVKVRLKYIVFTVSAVFFFGFTALLFHHHHLPLQLVSCGICEAKTSTSSAQSKPNTDWDFTAFSEPSPMPLYLVCYGLVAPLAISPTHSVRFFTFSNRAPPECLLHTNR
jgi:hypothetical protein